MVIMVVRALEAIEALWKTGLRERASILRAEGVCVCVCVCVSDYVFAAFSCLLIITSSLFIWLILALVSVRFSPSAFTKKTAKLVS